MGYVKDYPKQENVKDSIMLATNKFRYMYIGSKSSNDILVVNDFHQP